MISRIAHRAFYLNDEERSRFVDLTRRAAGFSGVVLLDWCLMTNHIHIFVFPHLFDTGSDAVACKVLRLLRNGPLRQVELRGTLILVLI